VFMRRLAVWIALPALFLGLMASESSKASRLIDPTTTKLGLLFNENLDLTSMTSAIYSRSDNSSVLNYKLCKSVSDSICTDASEIMIIQFFDLCATETSINCIAEVWARNETGVKIAGSYVRHVPSAGAADFPAAPEINLPSSKGNSFLVRFPTVTHKGGSDEYLVVLRNQTSILKSRGSSALTKKISVESLQGAISPVELVQGGFRAVKTLDGLASDGMPNLTPDGDRCFSWDDGVCAAIRDFPPKFKFGMSLRLSESLKGWFHGRIANPKISTTSRSSDYVISIEAEPVRVASLDFMVPASEVSQAAKDLIFAGEGWGHTGNARDGVRLIEALESEKAQLLLDLFNPNFRDRATQTSEYWSFKTLTGFRNDAISKCTLESGRLVGVVTTNALVYSAGPPSFNAAESSLDYKVSSPHFEASGQEAVGSYDLLLRSDVARCIYGFTEAPIKATLEVLGADGTTKVATTVINEKDGWLTMSASGFGFSAPLVRAKLSQEKVESKPTPTPTSTPAATATPSPTPTPTKAVIAANSKKTITCSRGASVKKVVAVNPKCPKGWKKRA
jgi:hypothetical protein